jgi:hypothetical protein
MFQLLKLKKCDTGISVLVEYGLPELDGGAVKDTYTGATLQDVGAWVEVEMMKYARKHLVAYVDHKNVISKLGRHLPSRVGVAESLERCKQLCRDVQGLGVASIAAKILGAERDLRNILPLEHDLSYNRSKWIVDDLVVWAFEILNHRKTYTVEQ